MRGPTACERCKKPQGRWGSVSTDVADGANRGKRSGKVYRRSARLVKPLHQGNTRHGKTLKKNIFFGFPPFLGNVRSYDCSAHHNRCRFAVFRLQCRCFCGVRGNSGSRASPTFPVLSVVLFKSSKNQWPTLRLNWRFLAVVQEDTQRHLPRQTTA